MPIGDNIPARMPESTGTVFFVDKDHGSASDSNAGTSESAPWLTVNKAFNDAPANAIVKVKKGATAYDLGGTFVVSRGGSDANNVITVEAYDPANKPVIISVNTDIQSTSGAFWRLRNLIFDANGGSGRALGASAAAHHIEVYGCETFGGSTDASGFQTRENPGPTEFIWFINCLSRNNGTATGDHGWYINGGRDIYLVNCISRDNSGYGFHVYNGSGTSHKINGVYFYNCLADGNTQRGGWLIQSDATQGDAELDPTLLAQDVHLYNCLSTNHPGASTSFGYRVRYGSLTDFLATGATPHTINDSLSFNNNSGDTSVGVPTNSVTITNLITGSNPLYVDSGSDDFHLEEGSPAYDAGSLEDTPTFDYDELTRIAATLGPFRAPEEAVAQVFGYSRLHGPAHLTTSPATLYTTPAGARARIRHIRATNPTGSEEAITLSIGTDAAATRIFDDKEITSEGFIELRHAAEYTLEPGESLQGFASAASSIVLVVNGYLEPA